MNLQLQTILDIIEQNQNLSLEERETLIKALKKADSDFTISEFKLERTEKIKRTTAILLEETIEELEQKRKSVEAQNRELEIESSLERVRSKAMAMRNSQDLAGTIGMFYRELQIFSITPGRCGVGLLNKESRMGELFTWNTTEQAKAWSTEKVKDKVEIRIKDNGMGIPQKIMDKIFQPFFTTKPAWEGTGLDLSLAYDIVTKGHGGELKVETTEDNGTTFIIQL